MAKKSNKSSVQPENDNDVIVAIPVEERDEQEQDRENLVQISARQVAELQDEAKEEAKVGAGYVEPNIDVAHRYRKVHHPHALDGSPMGLCSTHTGSYIRLCSCCKTSRQEDLIRFGSGISIYFKWLKLLGFMWLCMLTLQIPTIAVNLYAGSFYDDLSLPFASTTIGNLYKPTLMNNTSGQEEAEEEFYDLNLPFICESFECEISKDKLVFAIGLMDAVTVLVFLLFVGCSSRFARLEVGRFKKHVLKAEHYSLRVDGIPKNCTEEQLKTHFEGLVADEIYDVQIVHRTGGSLHNCVERGRWIRKLAKADAHLSFYQQKNFSESAIAAAQKHHDRVFQKVIDLDQKATSTASVDDALFAFVSFSSIRERNKCLNLYRTFTCSVRQSVQLRLEGKHSLTVNEAPPPSTLIWENNDVKWYSRACRLALVFLFMILILGFTLTINFATEPYKLSKNLFDSISDSGLTKTTSNICDGKFDMVDSLEEAVELAELDPPLLECLCGNLLNPNGAQFPTNYSDDGLVLFEEDQPCADIFSRSGNSGLSVQVAVSSTTLLMNGFIFLVLTGTGYLVRYTSVISREMTILRNMFFISYINTGLIVLLVNMDIPELLNFQVPGIIGTKLFGSGNFIDFSHEWYRVAGTEIILVCILNIFAPHAYPLIMATINTLRRIYHKPLSQSELNEMHLGPDFVLSYRYSQVLMMIFFVMTYSTGIPILYLFGLVSIILTYWVDKYFFTKVCRTPAQFGGKMATWATGMMPYAAVIHFLFGIWMLSSPYIFPQSTLDSSLGFLETLANAAGTTAEDIKKATTFSSENNLQLQERVFRDSSIPALLVLALMILFRVLIQFRFFVSLVERFIGMLIKSIHICLRGNPLDGLIDRQGYDVRPSFQKALHKHELIGIPSYNILENPSYARLFHAQSSKKRSVPRTLLEALRKSAIDVNHEDKRAQLKKEFSAIGQQWTSSGTLEKKKKGQKKTKKDRTLKSRNNNQKPLGRSISIVSSSATTVISEPEQDQVQEQQQQQQNQEQQDQERAAIGENPEFHL